MFSTSTALDIEGNNKSHPRDCLKTRITAACSKHTRFASSRAYENYTRDQSRDSFSLLKTLGRCCLETAKWSYSRGGAHASRDEGHYGLLRGTRMVRVSQAEKPEAERRMRARLYAALTPQNHDGALVPALMPRRIFSTESRNWLSVSPAVLDRRKTRKTLADVQSMA